MSLLSKWYFVRYIEETTALKRTRFIPAFFHPANVFNTSLTMPLEERRYALNNETKIFQRGNRSPLSGEWARKARRFYIFIFLYPCSSHLLDVRTNNNSLSVKRFLRLIGLRESGTLMRLSLTWSRFISWSEGSVQADIK